MPFCYVVIIGPLSTLIQNRQIEMLLDLPVLWGNVGADTNGNLYVQQHWVPDNDAVTSYSFMQQNYDYDSLNRFKVGG